MLKSFNHNILTHQVRQHKLTYCRAKNLFNSQLNKTEIVAKFYYRWQIIICLYYLGEEEPQHQMSQKSLMKDHFLKKVRKLTFYCVKIVWRESDKLSTGKHFLQFVDLSKWGIFLTILKVRLVDRGHSNNMWHSRGGGSR